MHKLKVIITVLSVVLILSGCISTKKTIFSGEFESYDRKVTVYHKNNIVTKEVYETTAPLEYWGYKTKNEARDNLQDEKKKLKKDYEKLPRGTVKFDFTVHSDETVSQKMTINYNDSKKLDALIKEGIVVEDSEMSDGQVSFNKHKFRFERNGLSKEK